MKIIIPYLLIILLSFSILSCKEKEKTKSSDGFTISQANEERAIELGKWGMPLLTFFAQKEASERDMNALPKSRLSVAQWF